MSDNTRFIMSDLLFHHVNSHLLNLACDKFPAESLEQLVGLTYEHTIGLILDWKEILDTLPSTNLTPRLTEKEENSLVGLARSN